MQRRGRHPQAHRTGKHVESPELAHLRLLAERHYLSEAVLEHKCTDFASDPCALLEQLTIVP